VVKYTQTQIAELNKHYCSGLNSVEACIKAGIPEGSFSYLMKKFGFSVRPKGFQLGNKTKSQFKKGKQFEIVCPQCNLLFKVPQWSYVNKRKYCSASCRSRYTTKGKKHWNWKGGISSKWDKLHNSIEYKEWRFAVWKRDLFCCQHCGANQSRSNPLHAHHIKPKAKYPDLIFDVGNGITLCRNCHNIVHYGRLLHQGRHS
jgi:hypothetical protein